MSHGLTVFAGVLLVSTTTAALANVTISTAATSNMSCSDNVCTPTAADAVLNVADLENLLATGNVEVTTTGSGVQANDIVIMTPVSWSSSNTLAIDTKKSFLVESQVTVIGDGSLSIKTGGGDKGGVEFAENGDNIAFDSTSSALDIDGTKYTLVSSVAALADAITSNPKGSFALASTYDASADGTYGGAPISSTFRGTFEGLGNAISNLAIVSNKRYLGLFRKVKIARFRNIVLINANITEDQHRHSIVGLLVGSSVESHFDSIYVGGRIVAPGSFIAGGMIGNSENDVVTDAHSTAKVDDCNICGGLLGQIVKSTVKISSATGTVSGNREAVVGGLVGQALFAVSTISQSFATGKVSSVHSGVAGGLIGSNTGAIYDTYATGTVSCGGACGGLLGINNGTVSTSYSVGVVSKDVKYSGGFVGLDVAPEGSIRSSYWDIDTSGITNLSQGAGNISNDPGITGLTSGQLQSGLPDGFSDSVWGQDSNVNGGFPYLISNPPG